MANVSVYNMEGQEVDKMELSDAVFGVEINEHLAPVPRDYSFKMNKKEKRAALKSVLTSRVQENKLIVVDDLKFDAIKTKDMVKVLDNLKADNALVVLNENDKNVVLSGRNIDGVKMALTNTIDVLDVLNHKTLVLTKDAAKTIEEVYA